MESEWRREKVGEKEREKTEISCRRGSKKQFWCLPLYLFLSLPPHTLSSNSPSSTPSYSCLSIYISTVCYLTYTNEKRGFNRIAVDSGSGKGWWWWCSLCKKEEGRKKTLSERMKEREGEKEIKSHILTVSLSLSLVLLLPSFHFTHDKTNECFTCDYPIQTHPTATIDISLSRRQSETRRQVILRPFFSHSLNDFLCSLFLSLFPLSVLCNQQKVEEILFFVFVWTIRNRSFIKGETEIFN